MTGPRATLDPGARESLRRMRLQLRRARAAGTGQHQSIFRGRGVEFDEIARHGFGDDIRDVDWNVTARRGELHRKVFRADREARVIVVLADDPALRFGSGVRSRRDALLEAAALLLMAGAVQREQTGLIHIRGDGVEHVPPSRARGRILAAAASLSAAPAGPLDTPARLDTVFPLLMTQPLGSTVFWLADSPSEAPPRALGALRRRHHVTAVRVLDPWDEALPQALDAMAYDPVAGRLVRLQDGPEARAAHERWRERRERLWREWWPEVSDRMNLNVQSGAAAALADFLHLRSRAAKRAA